MKGRDVDGKPVYCVECGCCVGLLIKGVGTEIDGVIYVWCTKGVCDQHIDHSEQEDDTTEQVAAISLN